MATDKKIVSTQITEEEKDALLRYCSENDETISRVLRKLIKEFLNKESNNE